jgi:putative acetyltransferase
LPEARNKSLGKMLINECFDIARENGYNQVYLETLPELSNAVKLYEKCGFTYLDKPLGNSGHFGCDLWMIKDL